MQKPQLLTCFEPIYVITTTSAPAEALNAARQEGGILCPSLRGPIKPGAKASPAAWDRLARPGGGGSPPNCSARSPGRRGPAASLPDGLLPPLEPAAAIGHQPQHPGLLPPPPIRAWSGDGPRWPRAASRAAFTTKSLGAVSLGGEGGRGVRAAVSPSRSR